MTLLVYFPEFKFMLLPAIGFYTRLTTKLSDQLGHPFFWLLQQTKVIIEHKTGDKSQEEDYFITTLLEARAEGREINGELDRQQYDYDTTKMIEKKMSYFVSEFFSIHF